jgi:hypothetical protein
VSKAAVPSGSTDLCGDASVEIPVTWLQAPAITVVPSRLFLGRTQRQAEAICRIKIKANDTPPVAVVEIRSSQDGLLHGAVDTSSRESVTLDFPIRTPAGAGRWRSFVVITLSHGRKAIRLPISGING